MLHFCTQCSTGLLTGERVKLKYIISVMFSTVASVIIIKGVSIYADTCYWMLAPNAIAFTAYKFIVLIKTSF